MLNYQSNMTSPSRRDLLKLAGLGAIGVPMLARADALRSLPIRVVVPYTAGGAIDMLGRQFAEVLKTELGTTAVVENRTGAGGMVAMRHISTSKPDGSIVGLGGSGPLIFSKLTKKDLPFDPDELEIVAPLGSFGYVLVTQPDNESNTFEALRDRSKAAQLNFASAQMGSSTQMALDFLKSETGLQGQAIPFTGDTDILNSVMSRSVEMGVVTVSGALALIEAGRVKPLAVTSGQRSARLPNVTTVRELGFPNYIAEVWTSLVVPKGTPANVQAQYNAIVNRRFAAPDMRDRLQSISVDFTPMTLDEVKAFRSRERDKWAQVARRAGIVPQ